MTTYPLTLLCASQTRFCTAVFSMAMSPYFGDPTHSIPCDPVLDGTEVLPHQVRHLTHRTPLVSATTLAIACGFDGLSRPDTASSTRLHLPATLPVHDAAHCPPTMIFGRYYITAFSVDNWYKLFRVYKYVTFFLDKCFNI